MTNRPEGDNVHLISSEMIIYIRPSAHAPNGLSLLLGASKRSQLKGMECGVIWDWIPPLTPELLLRCTKARDGRPLLESMYKMLLSFSMNPHGKTSLLCLSIMLVCLSTLLGFVTTGVLLFYIVNSRNVALSWWLVIIAATVLRNSFWDLRPSICGKRKRLVGGWGGMYSCRPGPITKMAEILYNWI